MRVLLALLLTALLVLGHALALIGPVATSQASAGLNAVQKGQGVEGQASTGHRSMDQGAMMGCCALADPGDDAAAGHCLADCLFILPLSAPGFQHQPVKAVAAHLRQGAGVAPPIALRPPIG